MPWSWMNLHWSNWPFRKRRLMIEKSGYKDFNRALSLIRTWRWFPSRISLTKSWFCFPWLIISDPFLHVWMVSNLAKEKSCLVVSREISSTKSKWPSWVVILERKRVITMVSSPWCKQSLVWLKILSVQITWTCWNPMVVLVPELLVVRISQLLDISSPSWTKSRERFSTRWMILCTTICKMMSWRLNPSGICL